MGLQLAIRNVLKHPFNQEKSAAGKKWFRSFLRRHPVISMRTPEGIASENLARGFDIFGSELRKINHPLQRITSVDETDNNCATQAQ
jgi:hypothetical protein